MTQLGADRYENTENYILFPTICHNINSLEASMKLYFYKDNKIFYCYTECGKMSIFSFLKHYYQTRNIDYDWFQDIYSTVLNCSTSRTLEIFSDNTFEKKKEKYYYNNNFALDTYPKGILDIFTKSYPIEWINDNISKKTMDKYNILYSISQNKIIIPHYDINNNLIGIRGRSLNQEEIELFGKYMPIKIENKWYSHKLSLNLYGLNLNKENIKKTGYVYLFESEKSVLQCEDFLENNCAVACCGSNFNKYQLKLLMKECHPKEIIICFDKEEKQGEDKYFYKLYDLCKKYTNYCNLSFVYDREELLDLKDSPSDKGEEIFKQLISKRIKVK